MQLISSKCMKSFSFYVSLNVFLREKITKQASLEVKKFPSLISSKCMKSFSFYDSLNVFLREKITKQASLEVKKFPSLISSKCMKSFSLYVSLNVFLHKQITKQAALEVKKFPPKRRPYWGSPEWMKNTCLFKMFFIIPLSSISPLHVRSFL